MQFLLDVGVLVGEQVLSERELMNMYPRKKVPEAVFLSGERSGLCTVEVKRVIGLSHLDGKYRGNGFVWKRTIESAVDKAHSELVETHGIVEHHVVLCVPAGRQIGKRLCAHSLRAAVQHLESGRSSCATRRVHIHIVEAPACVFADEV